MKTLKKFIISSIIFTLLFTALPIFAKSSAVLNKLSKEIESNNSKIKQIEINRKKLIEQKNIYLNNLSIAKNEISYAIINLHILFSTPEEILLITGATNNDLALSSLLFRGHFKYISYYIEDIVAKVKQINLIDKNINKSNIDIESLNKKINQNYIEISKLLKDKSANNNQEIKEKYKKIAELLKTVKTTTEATLIISENYNSQLDKENNKNFDKQQGSLAWPTQGNIVKQFKTGSKLGLYYNGIIIKTKSHSTIVSPAKGKIMFAGKLNSYGNTVIIKHTNSYYSIISNIYTLNTFSSQLVEKGQIIGLTELNKEDKVYYELRENITSLNPSLWLKKY